MSVEEMLAKAAAAADDTADVELEEALSGNWRDVVKRVREMDSVPHLKTMLTLETKKSRPKKTVMDAIQVRLQQLGVDITLPKAENKAPELAGLASKISEHPGKYAQETVKTPDWPALEVPKDGELLGDLVALREITPLQCPWLDFIIPRGMPLYIYQGKAYRHFEGNPFIPCMVDLEDGDLFFQLPSKWLGSLT